MRHWSIARATPCTRKNERVIDEKDDARTHSEIPRVDLDRLGERRRDSSEFGNDEGAARLGLADNVLHAEQGRVRTSPDTFERLNAPGRVHAIPNRRDESEISHGEQRKVFLRR